MSDAAQLSETEASQPPTPRSRSQSRRSRRRKQQTQQQQKQKQMPAVQELEQDDTAEGGSKAMQPFEYIGPDETSMDGPVR